MTRARLFHIGEALRQGPAAVALLSTASGSTPREMGAFMVISADRVMGTIGGGEAERRTIEAARAMLARGAPRETLALPLGPQLDQCCGGHMTVSIVDAATLPAPHDHTLPLWAGGPVLREDPARPVIVYGAGHVGAALVEALKPLPFALTWVDARPESEWDTPDAGVPCRRVALPETVAAAAPDDAFHMVMTHSHAVDLEIVAAVLSRAFGHCGLIGSATKRAVFARRLAERGIASDRLACPIGLPTVRGKEPAVIAAGVAAQLIALDRPGHVARAGDGKAASDRPRPPAPDSDGGGEPGPDGLSHADPGQPGPPAVERPRHQDGGRAGDGTLGEAPRAGPKPTEDAA